MRDIGCIFALLGVALAIGAFRPRARLASLLFACGFYLAHAGVHVFDTARGLFGSDQWQFDLVPVYGATLLLVGVTTLFARSRAATRDGES